MKNEKVTIFGGSGFLGKYIVEQLAKAGYQITVACRFPTQALHVKPYGHVGQIHLSYCNIKDEKSVLKITKGSDIVINLVGILYQSGNQKFASVHKEGAINIAKACKKNKVSQLIHISAIGADEKSSSLYAKTKGEAEKGIQKAFSSATILRPSIVFGPEDNFFNMFAKMTKFSPFLPLVGGGHTKFQPVYVVDIAKAVMKVIESNHLQGKIYELGGPNIYSFKELLAFLLKTLDIKRILLPIPFSIAKVQAFFMQLLPSPLLTIDQVKLLKSDNVVGEKALGFKELEIAPNSIEAVVPEYLICYKKGGQYSKSK